MDDTRTQRGQQWLEELLKMMAVTTDVKAELHQSTLENSDFPESDNCWLTINEANLQPETIQTLIGPQGTVLDAIQYLANATLNLNQIQEQQAAYTIELNGYRVQRQAEIRAIALSAAEQVRATGQEVEIKSLSSPERRQIHTLLKEYNDLETFSRGKEPNRHLVVRQLLS